MAQEQKLKREAMNATVASAPPLEQDELNAVESEVFTEGDITVERTPDGVEKHYLSGELHREDGPAIIRPGGAESWWRNGKVHRDGDLPAMTTPNGTRCWYKEGKLHREGGKPAVILPNGDKEYWVNGVAVAPEKKHSKRRIIAE